MKTHKIKKRKSRSKKSQVNTKKRIVSGLYLITGAALIGGCIGYTIDPVGARLGITDRLYHSLPADTRAEYAAEIFLEQEYDNQANIVKYFVDGDNLSEFDNAYLGTSTLLNLDIDKRAATLELIMQESPYDLTRHVTIYGLDNLKTEDSVLVLTSSGKKLWDQFGQKVLQAYDFLFGD